MTAALIPQLLSGLATGGIYAALALALVMIHQATHHVNFAQGEMATFSAYLAWQALALGAPFWIAFALACGISFAAGSVLGLVLMRPLRDAPPLAAVGVFVALLLITNSLMGFLWDHTLKPFPSPFAALSVPGGLIGGHELGAGVVTLTVLALVHVFFRHTGLGLAMRAAAFNPVSARLVGIRVERMLALGWGLAAAVGAVAGCLIAPIVFLEPNMMAGILLYAFAAALLGGIDSPAGAVAGGLLMGVIENLAALAVGPGLKLPLALAVIVGVLVLCPSGLFGRRLASRV